MIKSLKAYAKRFIPCICLYYIFNNLRIHFRLWTGQISTASGTTHQSLTIKDSLEYIQEVFEDYKTYGEIDSFSGYICEVGPGDNLGVALRILADGAERVDCVDRFFSHRDPQQQKSIYEAMGQHAAKVKSFTDQGNFEGNDVIFPRIHRYYGEEAALEYFFKGKADVYDTIVSRSVLEHATKPLEALRDMFAALKPGGRLIYKVDLRDHGMFSQQFDELKFYQLPQWLYSLMTYDSGYPNRILINDYKRIAETLPGKAKFYISQLAYARDVIPHQLWETIPESFYTSALHQLKEKKHTFARKLRFIEDKDLLVAGFFMVIEKPLG